MKIALLTRYFTPRWVAGIELATYNIATELAKKGHEIHVITSLDEGLDEKSIENGFTVHRLPYRTNIPLISLSSFFLKVRRKVREIDPDVLHIQNILWGWMGASMFRSSDIPYVVNAHGDDIYHDHRFRIPAIRYGARRAAAVIALTTNMKKEIEEVCDVEVCIVPNGVRFEGLDQLQMSRGEVGIPADAKALIFVGGLRPVKGVQYLIDAMSIIQEKRDDVHCLIVGDGTERAALEERVKSRGLDSKVHFLGRVENDKVPCVLSISDIFVLPSLSEGFPLVVLEAMASGLPLVCSAVGGTKDILVDGRNGFLVQPRNPQQIADCVLQLLESEKIRKQIAESNKTDVKGYDWKNVASRFEEIYLAANGGSIPEKQKHIPLKAEHHL